MPKPPMKRISDMTPEEYEAHKAERERLRRLAEHDPDSMTIDDIENLQDSDEYWTELALKIACDRLRAVRVAVEALTDAVLDQQRHIEAVQEAATPNDFLARAWYVLKATVRRPFTTTIIRKG